MKKKCQVHKMCNIILAFLFCSGIFPVIEHGNMQGLKPRGCWFDSKFCILLYEIYPLPNRLILDSSKLKEFADDYFSFDRNDIKSSKQVENIVGKGEIARYEQFLLFPQCFQTTCTANT